MGSRLNARRRAPVVATLLLVLGGAFAWGGCRAPSVAAPFVLPEFTDGPTTRSSCPASTDTECLAMATRLYEGDRVARDPAGAARLFEELCDGGLQRGCVGLAVLLLGGDGVAPDVARGQQLLDVACDDADALGCARLGALLSPPPLAESRRYVFVAPGDAPQPQPTRAAEYFERACAGLHAPSCARLGAAYLEGDGVEPDLERAISWFDRACRLRYTSACVSAGKALMSVSDDERARAMFASACERDDPEGCTWLGELHATTAELRREPARLREYYRRGCGLGGARGCYRYADTLIAARGGLRDLEKARSVLERGCSGGEPRSCGLAGAPFLTAAPDDAPDYDAMLAALDTSCSNGQMIACHHAAFLLYNWIVTGRDRQRAFALYARACDGGVGDACVVLGRHLSLAEDPAPDEVAARYSRACELGVAAGCHQLAKMERDPARARALVSRGCAAAYAPACEQLAHMRWAGAGGEREPAQARAAFARLCRGGHGPACRWLEQREEVP